MKPRLPLNIRHLFSAMLALLWMTAAAAAWARYPAVGQMDAVQRLARQLSLDSGLLAGTAGDTLPRDPDLNYPENLPFVAFHRAADQFYRQVTSFMQNPDHTESDFIALRDAYRRARMVYDLVPAPPAMRAAMLRTEESMRALIAYYSEERLPAIYDPVIVRQTAAQILDLADRLQARAKAQFRAGRVSGEEVRRIDEVNGAARRFYDLVINNTAPRHIDLEYDDLVQRLLDARMDMASFTMDFQDEYGALWHLAQSINYLSPGAAVGGPPYAAWPPWQ